MSMSNTGKTVKAIRRDTHRVNLHLKLTQDLHLILTHLVRSSITHSVRFLPVTSSF